MKTDVRRLLDRLNPACKRAMEAASGQCVQNGNRVLFNFYGDLEQRGGDLGAGDGFAAARDAIYHAIDRYPEHILMTSHLAEVVSTGTLFGERWGHHTCTSITSISIDKSLLVLGVPQNGFKNHSDCWIKLIEQFLSFQNGFFSIPGRIIEFGRDLHGHSTRSWIQIRMHRRASGTKR